MFQSDSERSSKLQASYFFKGNAYLTGQAGLLRRLDILFLIA